MNVGCRSHAEKKTPPLPFPRPSVNHQFAHDRGALPSNRGGCQVSPNRRREMDGHILENDLPDDVALGAGAGAT